MALVKPQSPVAGCSKNFNTNHDGNNKVDDSMQKNALCIQEIIPWAKRDSIYSYLKTHSNSSKIIIINS